jgi:hypothetical protein
MYSTYLYESNFILRSIWQPDLVTHFDIHDTRGLDALGKILYAHVRDTCYRNMHPT